METLEARQGRLADDLKRAGVIHDGKEAPANITGNKIANVQSEQDFVSTGLSGHYPLRRSHSDIFIDVRTAMEFPHIKENLGKILIMQLEENKLVINGRPQFELIMGPARGAIAIGEIVREILGNHEIVAIYPERGPAGNFSFEYPFPDIRQIPTLVVDDVFSTGGSIREMIVACDEAAETKNEDTSQESYVKTPAAFYFVGSAVGVNRVPDINKFKINTCAFPISYGLWIPTHMWPADECPLCRLGHPLWKI